MNTESLPTSTPSCHSRSSCQTHTSLPRLTTQATTHCLTGCAIGEFIGLAIGVTFGLGVMATVALATSLAFLVGFTLGLWPLVRQGKRWKEALKIIWLGEVISMTVMEIVMNLTDYHAGGMTAGSILEWSFWIGYMLAIPAGFIAAWPVNYLLLKRNIKQPCH
ncbi:MAG: hypothetical protein CMI09_12630 [Oceanospirillaceae bacterium]|nr:hypothetical protein [Oceanospirillaceae bacterium]